MGTVASRQDESPGTQLKTDCIKGYDEAAHPHDLFQETQ